MPGVKTYKPWIDGRGQPTMLPVSDGTGPYVTRADYNALADRFYASNRAIHALETKENATLEVADEPAGS